MQIAFIVEITQIARTKPAVRRKRLSTLLGQAVIRGEHVRPFDHHLAEQRIGIGFVDAQSNAGKRPSRVVESALAGEVESENGRCFGETVTRGDLPTEAFQLPRQCRFQGCTPRYDQTHVRCHAPTQRGETPSPRIQAEAASRPDRQSQHCAKQRPHDPTPRTDSLFDRSAQGGI